MEHKPGAGDLPMFIVDAFSSCPFGGNQAAVCLLEDDQDIADEIKQKLASEMNLSETAFVSKLEKDKSFQTGGSFLLRWFTPTNEVDLCGHATLATSAVLFNHYGNVNEKLTFETKKSGPLYATRGENQVVLDFPSIDPIPVKETFSDLVKLASCGLPVADVQISATRKLLIRLEDSVSRLELETLYPDVSAMYRSTPMEQVLGVIITIKGNTEYDFLSRYFAPWNGINEDPVTGSAHSVLTPYWARILGKKQLLARQCSKRGGDLYLQLRNDKRVDITGNFKIVLKGSVSVY